MEHPQLKPLPMTRRWGRRKWLFLEPWTPTSPSLGKLHIPKGYVSDGATVPRLLWMFFSPTGVLFIASLWHDFAIKEQYLVLDGETIRSDDSTFDNMFYQILIEEGVSPVTAIAAYVGVRIGSLFRRRK